MVGGSALLAAYVTRGCRITRLETTLAVRGSWPTTILIQLGLIPSHNVQRCDSNLVNTMQKSVNLEYAQQQLASTTLAVRLRGRWPATTLIELGLIPSYMFFMLFYLFLPMEVRNSSW